MYRIVIVDDEPIVREGISANIDWEALGFELVAACRDGREALEALERHDPDVVLTDICMPLVDGLELASWIAEQRPATKTILLTGYDEFEYAQEAVKLKVSDFLLKPITAQELRAVLEKTRTELDNERNRQRRLRLLQDQLKESMPLLRERFLNRLIKIALNTDEACRRMAFLELNLPGPWYVALVCDLDSWQPADQLTDFAVQKVVAEVAAAFAGSVAFSTPAERSVVLISGPDETGAMSNALECAELIAERATRDLGRTVSIGLGAAVAAFNRLPVSYNEARTALEHRMLLGAAQIVTVQQLGGGKDASLPAPEAGARERYARALRTGDPAGAEASLREFMAIVRRTGGGIENCYLAIYRLLADVLNAFEALGVEWAQIGESELNPFGELGRLKTLDSIEQWFRRIHTKLWEMLDERQQHHSTRKVIAAQEFIRENYSDPGLSLKIVCSALSVSKSYFSAMFKSYTGMTFVEYLTAVRMERAKELLSLDEFRSYEIAERVGFRDPHYFSLTFRKQTGLSPTQYRERSRTQTVR